MKSSSSFTHLVGSAGVFPVTEARTSILNWNVSTILESNNFRQKPSELSSNTILLEQCVSRSPRNQVNRIRDDNSELRVTMCGIIWLGTQMFGRGDNPLFELHALQEFLDSRNPPPINDLDGDFILTYVPPDRSCCFICRSVVGTRTVYYRFLKGQFVWSTNPTDLFLGEKPSISLVELELLPAMTIAGILPITRSCYRDIQRLPAGYCLQVKSDGSNQVSIDDFVIRDEYAKLEFPEVVSQLRLLIERAIHRKLAGCPKVGVLLSGGLDSAIVAFEAAKVTETVGLHWNWNELSILRDEQKATQNVAKKLGIELKVMDFSDSISKGGDYLNCMESLPTPFSHSFFRCFLGSAAAADELGLSVVASGHIGDELFHGHWTDPILAELSPVSNPLNLIRTFGALLVRQSRVEAGKTLLSIPSLNQQKLEGEHPRLKLAAAFLTPSAFEKAREFGCHVYDRQDLPSISSRELYSHNKSSLNRDAELDTATISRAFLPRGVALTHPYADRTLLEFCLSLAPRHRASFHGGVSVRKPATRLAYLKDLPQEMIGRESRVPYVAVAETYCRNNSDKLFRLLGKGSLLTQLKVISLEKTLEVLNSPSALKRFSPALIRIAGVEMWLRFLEAEN